MGYFTDYYSHVAYPKETLGRPNSGLRQAQLGAMHAVAAHFTTNTLPALVVMPTGSGKTAVLTIAPYLLGAGRVLIVTPSRLVREQIADDIKELRTLKRLGVLPQEISPPKTRELATRIKSMSDWEALRDHDVVIAAPPSVSPTIAGIPAPPAVLFDLLLIDEAHHEQAATWQSLLNAFKTAKRVLFTATPYRRDGRELKAKLAYVYDVRAAFENKIFGKVRFSPVQPAEGVSEDLAIAREAERIFNEDKHKGLKHRLLVRTDMKTRAKELEQVYQQNTQLRLQSIHSGHGLKHIRQTIQRLVAGELDGVVCVDMMGEGFDFPSLKIAAIHSPHRSLAVTLQFIGRFARTNAPDVGEATFISVPQDIEGEMGRLYRAGAVWQEIITDLHGAKITAEQENREIVGSFEPPIIDDLKTEDIPLSALSPFHHIKVLKVASDIDIHQLVSLPPPLEAVHQRVTAAYDAAVIIGYEQRLPEWTDLPSFRQHKFELFVVYYHAASKLLFINASVRGAALYQHIARQYTGGRHRNLSISRINGVLRGVENPRFFNIGMKNRSPTPRSESYRISAGPSPDQAIDETVARLNHRGHVFGNGQHSGKDVTIGYSSASKIWSNTESNIPEFIKWCESLAQRIMSDLPMPKLPGLDLLPCSQEITSMPEAGVVAIDWPPEAYKSHMNVVCPTDKGAPVSCEISAIELRVDRRATDRDGVRVLLGGPGWEYPIHFVLAGMPQFTRVDDRKPEPMLKRGFSHQSIIDFLNDHPLNIYLSDFSRVTGAEHFNSDVQHEPFDPNHIEVVDWPAAGVTITEECGLNSIQEHLKTFLMTVEHEVVLHDHGTGEIADFVTMGIVSDTVKVSLYHVKGSGGENPGNRVDDVYEVCGQVVKSLIWLRTPDALFEKIKERRRGGSTWLKGDDAQFEQLFRQGSNGSGFDIRIGLVQPGITKARIEPKLCEVIAAARSHVKSCGPASLFVLASA
jgi:superfamily II DNA or RNA helicase